MCVAMTAASAAAAVGRYSGSRKPLMSLPITAPAANAARATADRPVSTESGTSKRRRNSSIDSTASSLSSRLTDRPDPDATGAGADVDHIGALPHEPLGVPQEGVQLEVRAAIVERVARAVQDAHD
jgi:hypothetical protein